MQFVLNAFERIRDFHNAYRKDWGLRWDGIRFGWGRREEVAMGSADWECPLISFISNNFLQFSMNSC